MLKSWIFCAVTSKSFAAFVCTVKLICNSDVFFTSLLKLDKYLRVVGKENVFGGGDALKIDLITTAVGHGRKAADSIDLFLKGKELPDAPYEEVIKVKEQDIPDHDILTGGFPCQSFSNAGKKKCMNDERGTLFHEIIRIAKLKDAGCIW